MTKPETSSFAHSDRTGLFLTPGDHGVMNASMLCTQWNYPNIKDGFDQLIHALHFLHLAACTKHVTDWVLVFYV
jgi:hypothetical protein